MVRPKPARWLLHFLDLLKQAAELGCMAVRSTGGEPLLRPDFPELYIAARRLGIKVILLSNGRLIIPDIAAFPKCHRDGWAGSRYTGCIRNHTTLLRGKGIVCNRHGVDLFLEYAVPFVVKQAFLPQNRDEREEFERWANDFRYG